MKIFRTAFILPAIVIIALIWIFFALFFDIYLKKAFVATGQAIFGAKVEIASVDTKFTKLTLNINSLKIGDKDNEYKNIADIDNINFKIRFTPLLSKKVIIDNMSVSGFKWGTARKTSCKLPPRKQKKEGDSFLDKAMKQAKETALAEFNSFPAVDKFSEIQKQVSDFSAEGVIDMAGIKSVGVIQDSYIELMKNYDSYSKTINSIDIKPQIENLKTSIDKISKTQVKTAADITELKKNLESLDEQRKSLEKTFNELKDIQANITKDINNQKNTVKNINTFINKDVDNIASTLSIPSMDFKNISRMLFGNIWVQRVDKVLFYMETIRKYIPESNKEDKGKAQTQERMKGRDVIFPIKDNLPTFWIANVSISGTTGGEGKEGTPIDFSGFIKNITSNQRMIGQNTIFEIKGNDSKQSIKITGKFDRLKDTAEDTISAVMDGVDAVVLGIPETDYTPSFASAKARINADFKLIGSSFTAKAGITVSGLAYDASTKDFSGVDPAIVKYINLLWQGVNNANVNAGMSILPASGLKADFSSDLDKILGQRFNNVFNAAIGDVREKIRKEITNYVNVQTKSLQAESDKYKTQIQSELEPKVKDIQAQIDSAKELIKKKEEEIKKQTLGSLLQKKETNTKSE